MRKPYTEKIPKPKDVELKKGQIITLEDLKKWGLVKRK